MKKFKDLDFQPHICGKGIHARMTFADGSKISVVQGEYFYSGPSSFEMLSNRSKSDGIRGWISEQQITKHMAYIQRNPLKK